MVPTSVNAGREMTSAGRLWTDSDRAALSKELRSRVVSEGLPFTRKSPLM